MENCLFCKIVKEEIPADKVYEDDQILGFRDINPQAPVHILLIPKKHIATSVDATEEDRELMGSLFLAANTVAKQNNVDEKGFRLVVNCNDDAGQEVHHIHFHVLGGRRMTWPPG